MSHKNKIKARHYIKLESNRYGPDAHVHDVIWERWNGLGGGRTTRHSHPGGAIKHDEHTVTRFAGGRTLHSKPTGGET